MFDRKKYALKEMIKVKVLMKKSAHSVMNERKILGNIKHDFIVNMHYAFQDSETLYLVMDLLTGGDLRLHISKRRVFSEAETKFVAACIVYALEYLAQQEIIHRDLKPENLVVDYNGYVKLTDMGIARYLVRENNMDTSGTPGYMSPEVMCCANHDYRADYYALGVIVYEMMLGYRPYVGANRKEIRADILSRQEHIKPKQVPKGWNMLAADFANRLLMRKPNQRLGSNGIQELKNHPWFENFDWEALQTQKMKSPFKPLSMADIEYNVYQTTFDYDNLDDEMCSEDNLYKLFIGYEHNLENLIKSSTESTKSTENLVSHNTHTDKNTDSRSKKPVQKEALSPRNVEASPTHSPRREHEEQGFNAINNSSVYGNSNLNNSSFYQTNLNFKKPKNRNVINSIKMNKNDGLKAYISSSNFKNAIPNNQSNNISPDNRDPLNKDPYNSTKFKNFNNLDQIYKKNKYMTPNHATKQKYKLEPIQIANPNTSNPNNKYFNVSKYNNKFLESGNTNMANVSNLDPIRKSNENELSMRYTFRELKNKSVDVATKNKFKYGNLSVEKSYLDSNMHNSNTHLPRISANNEDDSNQTPRHKKRYRNKI